MNFQDLQTVGTPDFYLDVAIKRTKKKIEEMRAQKMRIPHVMKAHLFELTKLDNITQEIENQLMKVLKSFPTIDNLPEFYKELIQATLDVPYLKRSLGSLGWCIKKNKELCRLYKTKIKGSTEEERINQYRREFYGRVSSTMKQIKPHLEYLENARKIMKDYPSIKTAIPTVAIAGFPNVGKSTFLGKITPAKPKIANYAFTTQGINLGYSEIKGQKIQFMDTPGTLARFEKQNTVEKIATMALKYVAEAIVYVFDLTESSYPIEQQMELYEVYKKTRKPMIIYISKTDILEKKKVDAFKKQFKIAATTVEGVQKEIAKIEFM